VIAFLEVNSTRRPASADRTALPSGVGRSLGAKISGGRGHPWGIFFGFYKTRHILLSNSRKVDLRFYVPLDIN